MALLLPLHKTVALGGIVLLGLPHQPTVMQVHILQVPITYREVTALIVLLDTIAIEMDCLLSVGHVRRDFFATTVLFLLLQRMVQPAIHAHLDITAPKVHYRQLHVPQVLITHLKLVHFPVWYAQKDIIALQQQ